MIILKGEKIFNGIAIGKIKFYAKSENTIVRAKVTDTEAEISRYEEARNRAIAELNALYESSLASLGDGAEIFNVHSMMLEDDDYNDSVHNIITTQEVNAEYAVATTSDNFSDMFDSMDDEYFRARSADIKDISERVIRILSGRTEDNFAWDEPVIIVAEDLAPSETVQMDKSKLMAFVTHLGSANSHTAILARTMGIPAIIGAEVSKDLNGRMGIVDGYEGAFIIDPDEKTMEKYLGKKAADEDEKKQLLQLKGKENVTLSGQKINVFANIGSPADLYSVLEHDAGGIGLFRSEFLYLESGDYPSEEEQFAAYKKVVETMGGRKVIIRTLDIGADKQADYFNLDKEENPALGLRAIRICLTRPEIFKTQLRALYRASAYGNLAIMYPMIISVDEIRQIKEISKEVRREMTEAGIKIGNVEEGIMIETPAAVIIADDLAKEVDFFSIGTNDLTQYTLAIDRQNSKLDRFYNPHHPAILKMLKMVADSAHKAGIWAGICGELGADTELTEYFLEIGMDELSVSPGCILPLRKIIREIK